MGGGGKDGGGLSDSGGTGLWNVFRGELGVDMRDWGGVDRGIEW